MAPRAQTPLPVLVAELGDCHRAITERLAGGGLEMVAIETLLLATLAERAHATPTELSEALSLSRGRITHLIDSLAEHDLVARRPDPQDRRRSLISLTAEGRRQGEDALARVRETERAVIDEIGPAGFDMLAQQLEVVRRACSR